MLEDGDLEYVRPQRFATDHEWAQASQDAVILAEEQLGVAEHALRVCEEAIRDWREWCEKEAAAGEEWRLDHGA